MSNGNEQPVKKRGEKMADDLGNIEDPVVRGEVQHVYERLINCQKDVALTNTIDTMNNEGEKKLEEFVKTAKKPFNLLYIDSTVTKNELVERLMLLGILYRAFKKASIKDRNHLEKMINDMFEIPEISQDAQNYLDQIAVDPITKTMKGAENKNLIFKNSALHSEVIKRTMDRHEIDFASVLKLMYDMHAIALRFNHEPMMKESGRESNEVDIQLSFKDMLIYREPDGAYRRMVRQDFAEGTTMKELSQEIKNSSGFQVAWKMFLEKVSGMRETDGIVLDISDSSAGFKKQRGNVNNTGNVVVKISNENPPHYTFIIIDPDVFDTDPGEHKFDAKEHIRSAKKVGILKSFLKAAMISTINYSRENIVRPWQDAFILKKHDL